MELKVALCQFDMVWEDTAANLRTAGRMVAEAEYLEREEGSSVTVSAQVGLGSYIRFTIADPKEGETLPYVNLSFENQNMEDGKVYISRMSDGVFSGTFEGGRITEGRFDLKYKE